MCPLDGLPALDRTDRGTPGARRAPLQHQTDTGSAGGASAERILDTAETLFARRGYEGVGLREISRLTRLSKSALFHHFPTKMDLYIEVIARILGDLEARLAEFPRVQGDAISRLVGLVDAMIDALSERPTRAPLLMRTFFEREVLAHDAETPEIDGPIERMLETISSLLREGIESGAIRPIAIPHATQSLIGMLLFQFASGEFGEQVLGQPVFAASEIRRHREFVLSFIERGLAAQRPDPQGDPTP